MIRRVMALGLVTAMACSRNDGPKPLVVQDLTLTSASASITVGSTTVVTATAVGIDGNVIPDAPVSWSTVTPSVINVSSSGVVIGLQQGQGTVRAVSGGKTADLAIEVKNPQVATLAFDRDSAVLTLPGGTLTLVPLAKDAAGRAIDNPTLFFSSDAPLVASVTQLGVVTALAAGTAVVSGNTDALTAYTRIRVTANSSATSPRITSVTPLAAGGTAVITGSNFAPSIGGNAVRVEGVLVTITAATTTQLNITLPFGAWACAPVHPAFIQVNANNEIGVATASLQVANLRTLAVGQSVVVSNASAVRCNELAATGGSYLVTVYNPARVMSGMDATFTLRGLPSLAGSVAAASAAAAAAATDTAAHAPRRALVGYPAIGSQQFARAQALGLAQRGDAAHASVMERSLAFARAAGSPTAAWRRFRASTEGAAATTGRLANQVAQLGTITPLKIPNLDAVNFCTSNIPVGARTAWVGQHAVIVEDTTTTLNGQPTLKGQLDSLYAVIGQEFDTVMWPILTTNFGNPLAMDDTFNNRIGKIVMLFSPRINTMASGAVEGFVVSCDFFLASQAPSSNEGEYFYAIMPTSSGTKAGWLRSMRSTIIHEAKHITSFGERFKRNQNFEELWLEEGTARHAEELYARGIYGVQWKGNVDYQSSVYCDVRLTSPQCAGRPVLMLRHFDALYQYLQSPEPYSVIGPVASSDATFYATSWSIVRWMIDHYATSEATFLSQLVQSGQAGVANLEARVGASHPWEEMFGEWALTMYTDDYPGVTFSNPHLKFPSWNLRSEFRGLCEDYGPCKNPALNPVYYPLAFPLTPRPLAYGNFSDTVNFLNAASFSTWLLSGTQLAPQLIEVRSTGGGDPPSQLRIAIVRLQ